VEEQQTRQNSISRARELPRASAAGNSPVFGDAGGDFDVDRSPTRRDSTSAHKPMRPNYLIER
jgi:hypothetical protein